MARLLVFVGDTSAAISPSIADSVFFSRKSFAASFLARP